MPSLKLPRLCRQQSPAPPADEPEVENEYDDEDGHGERMGFFEHLNELRIRFFRAAVALVLGTMIGIGLAAPALDYLRTPYCRVRALNEAAALGEEIDVDNLTDSEATKILAALGPKRVKELVKTTETVTMTEKFHTDLVHDEGLRSIYDDLASDGTVVLHKMTVR